jgi:hypothetical protein
MSDILVCTVGLRNNGAGSARITWDDANSKLVLSAELVGPTVATDGETAATGLIQDEDLAATNGVLVYAHIDGNPGIAGAARGHLEFVSPTDADGRGEFDATYKGQYFIKDNDAAATNGYVVKPQAAGAGFRADFDLASPAGGGPIYVPLSAGGTGHANINYEKVFLAIADSDTATDPSIYFDEDAAEESERMLCVVVDNADETYPLYTVQGGMAEVPSGTDCSLVVADLFAIGKR